jgi:hypothetical protein
MKYGIIFWGNSPSSKMIFTLQKKTARVIAGVKSRNSCRYPFIRLEILALPFQYILIFTSMNFVVNNLKLFQANSSIHSVKGMGKFVPVLN